MESSIERTGCKNFSLRSDDSFTFSFEKCCPWENSNISKVFSLLTYFSRDTTKVLGKGHHLKLRISSRISLTNSKTIQHVHPA